MPKPHSVLHYRIRNGPQYNRALIKRGSLSGWFDEQAMRAWRHTDPCQGPGVPRIYSELTIECALVFKSFYHFSLRATQGLLTSVIELRKPRYSSGTTAR